MSSSIVLCCKQVSEAVGVSFDEQDLAVGADGMGRLYV
jgi:hypothetical protein